MRKRCRRRVVDVPPIPPSFGITHGTSVSLGLKEAAALDALLAHEADGEHFAVLESAAEWSIHALDIQSSEPGNPFDDASLTSVRAVLIDGARALLLIKERHQRTGTYGCTGPEREALRLMRECIDELRSAITRRVWIKAGQRARAGNGIHIPREAPHA